MTLTTTTTNSSIREIKSPIVSHTKLLTLTETNYVYLGDDGVSHTFVKQVRPSQ